ncbi:hypothetical protein C2G38_2027458 [Gigaspora rosea]|uniref:Uncharacterized protein n=1 Tax=Gigaspora rosea TaxID=44941 RepID=A0A397W636_9GLOM|nr:hypothetical protein C2G38_2027458 [Gigaspora rosea]
MAIFNMNDEDYLDCVNEHDLTEVIVLEVNNTFCEKHLYILDHDSEADKLTRLGFVMSFTINRAFPVKILNQGEKWLWKGVIKLLKSEKDYEKEFCKIDNKEKKEKKIEIFLKNGMLYLKEKNMIILFLANNNKFELMTLL